MAAQTEIIEESPASIVYRSKNESSVAAIKCASYSQEYSKEPHDIVKELKILSNVQHTNIIDIIGYNLDDQSCSVQFWMPFVPHSLFELLNCPSFLPTSPSFEELAKSITFQLISAVSYLHNLPQPIAHRDLKPRNVLITSSGCVKLIDFGVSWDSDTSYTYEDIEYLWPEKPERMYFEVATGPYRAPELLFGTRNYDAPATDLWGLGCIIAEFFTPLNPSSFYDDDSDDEEEGIDNEPVSKLSRASFFPPAPGEIGLLWSIFKTKGTPNEDVWPGYSKLPNATSFLFTVVSPVETKSLLPHLPPSSPALDLIEKLIVYPPPRRLPASEALEHPWLASLKGLPVELGGSEDQRGELQLLMREFL